MIIGVDVGRFKDRTACIAFDKPHVVQIRQLVGLSFLEQIKILKPLLKTATKILVDTTGLGIGFYEILQSIGLPVVGVNIVHGTGGKVKPDGRIVIGKQALVSLVRRALPDIGISSLDEAVRRELHLQLSHFRFSITPKNKLAFTGGKVHDDLVVALGLAILGELQSDNCTQGGGNHRGTSANL